MRHTTLLANHCIKEYEQHLLKSKDFLFGVNVRPFDFAVNEKNMDTKSLELSCYKALQDQTFSTIQDIILYPKTIQSLLTLTKELQCYGISLDNLPRDTELHHDIHRALSIIQDIYHDFTINEQTEYHVFPYGLSHAETTYLQRINAQFEVSPNTTPQSIQFKVGLNIRHEIEAVIQEILSHQYEDVVIALPNLNGNAALVEASFKRYDLDYPINNHAFELIKKQFLSIMNLHHFRSLRYFYEFLESNPLNLKESDNLMYYIQHFELSLDDVLQAFNYVDESTKEKDMILLQHRIQDDVLILQGFLYELMGCDFTEALSLSYNTLKSINFINLKPLQNFIETNYHLYSKETYPFFLNHFNTLSQAVKDNESIRIVDISALPHFTCKHLYVLNLGASSYPSISKRTGIIDEQYLSQIKDYPSLEERTQYQLNDQKRLFELSDNLTLSYASSTYEGKGIEVSYPIDVYCKERQVKLQAWELEQITDVKKQVRSLSSKQAQSLYLKEGKIVGSISAFQKYLEEPYEFFIERALLVRKPERITFDPRIIGTLNHSIVEHTVFNITDSSWDEIMKIFPKHSPRIQMIRKRNDAMMLLVNNHLKEAIADTNLTPLERESWFDTSELFDKIRLRGIIDRIDANDHQLIVIDYKSSKQSLQPAAVVAGRQLQLLTYALIAKREYNRDVLGVFYYGFRFKNTSTSRYSYSFSKGLLENTSNPHDSWMSNQKFTGWFFETPENTFNSPDYFGGLKEGKSGMNTTSIRDIEVIEEVLKTIYNDIQHNILNGVLDTNSIKMTLEESIEFRKGRDKA